MIHRLALVAGSVAAAAILAIGFLATGFGPRASSVDAEQPTAGAATDMPGAVAADADANPKPVTRVETTTVYVRPAHKPKVIHITRRTQVPAKHRPARTADAPVVHRGGDDGGGERGDD